MRHATPHTNAVSYPMGVALNSVAAAATATTQASTATIAAVFMVTVDAGRSTEAEPVARVGAVRAV